MLNRLDRLIMRYLNFIPGIIFLLCSCSSISDSNGENGDNLYLSVSDIKAEYRIVDSLNTLSFDGDLDTDNIDRSVVLGVDERNNYLIIRRCDETRLFGCIMYYNVFGLFYENCDSLDCETLETGVTVIDHEGYVGTPRFVGCSPDTS